MSKLFVKKSSKKIVVANKVVFRKSFFRKAFGLMCHKKIHDEAHIFLFNEKKKVALTMWWVFFSIDVLFLDENQRIVEIKKDFKPFTNYYPEKECKYVIELPEGTISKMELKLNDILDFN